MKMNELAASFPPEAISIHGAQVRVRSPGVILDYIIGCDGELWLVSNVTTDPPAGCFSVKNLYVKDGKLIAEWDDGS